MIEINDCQLAAVLRSDRIESFLEPRAEEKCNNRQTDMMDAIVDCLGGYLIDPQTSSECIQFIAFVRDPSTLLALRQIKSHHRKQAAPTKADHRAVSEWVSGTWLTIISWHNFLGGRGMETTYSVCMYMMHHQSSLDQ